MFPNSMPWRKKKSFPECFFAMVYPTLTHGSAYLIDKFRQFWFIPLIWSCSCRKMWSREREILSSSTDRRVQRCILAPYINVFDLKKCFWVHSMLDGLVWLKDQTAEWTQWHNPALTQLKVFQLHCDAQLPVSNRNIFQISFWSFSGQ